MEIGFPPAYRSMLLKSTTTALDWLIQSRRDLKAPGKIGRLFLRRRRAGCWEKDLFRCEAADLFVIRIDGRRRQAALRPRIVDVTEGALVPWTTMIVAM